MLFLWAFCLFWPQLRLAEVELLNVESHLSTPHLAN